MTRASSCRPAALLAGPARGVLAAALGAAAALTGLSSPAAAVTTVAVSVNPEVPTPGQPLRLNAHGRDMVGEASYSWDLDGDGVCETPFTSISYLDVTWPRGARNIHACVRDAGQQRTAVCPKLVIVGPEPIATLLSGPVDPVAFAERGATIRLRWNMPVSVGYRVEFTTGGTDRLPLAAVAAVTGTDVTLTVPAPPGGIAALGADRRGWIEVQPDFANDPAYAAIGLSGDGVRVDVAPSRQPGAGAPDVRSTGLLLVAHRTGRTVRVTLLAGGARGRVVRLYVRSGDTTNVRTLRLRSASTVVRFRLAGAQYRRGRLWVGAAARFTRDGQLYETRPSQAGAHATLRWRSG